LVLTGLAARQPVSNTSDERDEITAMPFEASGELEFEDKRRPV
jgi:hypothetical protein